MNQTEIDTAIKALTNETATKAVVAKLMEDIASLASPLSIRMTLYYHLSELTDETCFLVFRELYLAFECKGKSLNSLHNV